MNKPRELWVGTWQLWRDKYYDKCEEIKVLEAELASAMEQLRLRDRGEMKEFLGQLDAKLRQMQADGEITMKEMIVGLKPLMWINQAMSADNDDCRSK